MKDQLVSVTPALQNFGQEMRSMRQSIENLHYERVDCPGTVIDSRDHTTAMTHEILATIHIQSGMKTHVCTMHHEEMMEDYK